jgi:serine-type D-Ala-D-Ala carboxypeptidase (penicillin-binding protein 5/6)
VRPAPSPRPRHAHRSTRARRTRTLRRVAFPVAAALAALALLVSLSVRGGPANAGPAVAGTSRTSVARGGASDQVAAAKLESSPSGHRTSETTTKPRNGKVPVGKTPTSETPTSKAPTRKVPTTETVPVVPTSSEPKTTAPPAKVPVPQSRSYVLVDVDTGNVLAGHDERLRLPPASLTKVLVALIAVGYLSPDEGVAGTTVSEDVYPNRVGMEKGVPWPLPEVLQSLLVYSANDAAYAIADHISGTLRAFAPVMERSAQQIGMQDDPLFRDPAGLDGPMGFEGGNLVSARDLAIAGRDLLGVPELAQIVREKNYHFVDPKGQLHWLPSMDFTFLDTYPGAVGIKTGFTDRAGDCLMAAATRGKRTMLAVVMNGYNPTQTAIDLLNTGFATPVSTEPTTDRLPPPKLPSPPKVIHVVPVLAHKTPITAAKPHTVVSCTKGGGQPHPENPRPSPAQPCRLHPAV